jgi:hypothetical protein
VVEKKFVKEDLVGVLQSTQINVPLQVIVFLLVGFVSADNLLLKALDVRREKSVQAKLASLPSRESRTFVHSLAVEEIHPVRRIRET